MTNINKTLSELGLTPEDIRIYVYLLEHGGDTAGHIAKKIGVKRSSLYGVLQKMTDKGVIKRSLFRGVRTFSAEPPESLYNQFSKKLEYLQDAQNDFKQLLPELNQLSKTHQFKPRIEIFEGKEAIQNIMQDVLLHRDIETLSLWPIKSMLSVLSPEYFKWHNRERIQNNISIRAIWPRNEVVNIADHPYMGKGHMHKREIRVIDGDINTPMAYWIYGNKIMFISSTQESFGFIIESASMAAFQKEQWKLLWDRSTPLQI